MVEMKKCTGKCGEEKPLVCFYKHRNECKECRAHITKEYRNKNKIKLAQKSKTYREKNKEKISKNKKIWYTKNKINQIKKSKDRYKNNKQEMSIYNKNYYRKNSTKIKSYSSNYKKNNKSKRNEYEKIKRNNDPSYKLRLIISTSIREALFSNGSSKNKKSCWNYISYSKIELKQHIENLFDSWMTWKNHGVYDPKTWDDNDPSTWKWQLDHITPQSDLPYSSMEDENFKKCWALGNLRPYSAKLNSLDGSNRIRHMKENL